MHDTVPSLLTKTPSGDAPINGRREGIRRGVTLQEEGEEEREGVKRASRGQSPIWRTRGGVGRESIKGDCV